MPGGRLVCVVGDVCVARRDFGRRLVRKFSFDEHGADVFRHLGVHRLFRSDL